MLQKKFYIPIGALILAICAVGLFSLHSDTPKKPTVIYKPTITETPAQVTTGEGKDTSTGGHFHADGTWHNQPHTEETVQEKNDSEIQEKATRLQRLQAETAKYKAETATYKAETATYKAETATYKAELATLKAKAAERTKYLSRITEKGKEFVAQFPDMLEMIPKTYLALSETEQEKFLLRCVEYDLFVEELQEIVNSTPQWILDEWDDKQPGYIDEFLNLPSLTELYGSL